MKRAVLLAVVVPLVVAVPGAARQTAPAPRLLPTTLATSFRATVRHGNVLETYAWQLPESFAQRRRTQAAFVGDVVERGGTRFYGASGSSPGIVERRVYAARPDAYSFSDFLLAQTEFVLARARARRLRLAPASVGRRPALRGKVFLHANECAGLRAGSREVWLDRATLLPLRIRERRGRETFSTRVRYSGVGAPVPARAFEAPRLGPRAQRADLGFVRAAPLAAADKLSYVPRLPRTVPPRFRLAVSGWARRSARTGPEGSNPPYRDLFAAVYRRGLERIDVTQRLAGRQGWIGDPFGAECEFQFEGRVRVHGRAARYGLGPSIVPHLYWREGPLLFTVSGALPKRELVAVAASLAPIR